MSAPHTRAPGLASPFELCSGAMALFTGRAGGISAPPYTSLNLSTSSGDSREAVSHNRDVLLRAIGPGPARLAWMNQVHGATTVYMADGDAGTAGPKPEADAAFTDSPAVALAVLAADCAPVLLADPVARLVGAAHAGRLGMVAGVASALVGAMVQAGADPGRVRAVVGPSICGLCYEVPAEMRDQVADVVPESACLTRKGTPGIDIRAGLRAQLASLGIADVAHDLRCTAESAELYSYRRDGRTGRFAGVVWLTA